MFKRPKDVLSSKEPGLKIRPYDVGGKAWNLFRLDRSGFAGPPFCVIPTHVFNRIMKDKKVHVDVLLKAVTSGSAEEIERLAAPLRDFLHQTEFARDFRKRLSAAVKTAFGPGARLAVRSSIVGEDSARHSFAGQMDSFLNVSPTDVPDAVRKVWASAFSFRALTYRKEKQIRQERVSVAVILQEMVPAEASGILFTRDPDSRRPECVISAGFGLGEGVVSDRVETDTYRIPRQGNSIIREIAVKDLQVVGGGADHGGTRVERVPGDKKKKPVLSEEKILLLRRTGLEAERLFGTALDIEWAFDARGRLFVLQARPIVFPEPPSADPTHRIWDNSNVVESYPGLTLPLTFSFVRRCYEKTMKDAVISLTWSKKTFRNNTEMFRNMIGLLDGRVYYNLLNWYGMQACFPGFKKYKDSWDRMIGISQQVPFPRPRVSSLHRLSSSLLVFRTLLSVGRTAGKFFRVFNKSYSRFGRFEISRADEHELLAYFDSLEGELGRKWYLTLSNDLCAIKYYDWLRRLCSRWGLDGQRPNLHNDLLCGEKGIESVAPVRSLIRLAEAVRSNPSGEKLLSIKDDLDAWHKIQTDPALAPLKRDFAAHLQSYGDRGLEELKLDHPAFREEPAQLISLVRDYLSKELSVESMEERERSTRQEAEAVVRTGLKNPLRRLVFRFVLRNARVAIASRENMRFARTRVFGLVRRVFRRLGDLFQEKGILDRASDIHFLTVDEVFGLIQGTAVTQDVRSLVALRAAEYRRHSRAELRERFETRGIPYLDLKPREKGRGGADRCLKGTSCSSGAAQGTARIVLDPGKMKRGLKDNGKGDSILVARSTDPGWVFLMIASKGIVTERGSVLSHTAIIGRELGIPTIVGVKGATSLIPDGARLHIDGETGVVRWQ